MADTSRTTFDSFAWGDASLDENLRGTNKISSISEALHTLENLNIEENPRIASLLIERILKAEPKRALDPTFIEYIHRQTIGSSIPSTEWIGEAEFKADQGVYLAYLIHRHDGKLKYNGKEYELSDLQESWGYLALNPRTGILAYPDDIPDTATVGDSLKAKEIKQEKMDDFQEGVAVPQDEKGAGPIKDEGNPWEYANFDYETTEWNAAEWKQASSKVNESNFNTLIQDGLERIDEDSIVTVTGASPGISKSVPKSGVLRSLSAGGNRKFNWKYMAVYTSGVHNLSQLEE